MIATGHITAVHLTRTCVQLPMQSNYINTFSRRPWDRKEVTITRPCCTGSNCTATAAGVNCWSTSVCRTTNRQGTHTSPKFCSTTKLRSMWNRIRRWWNTRYTAYVRWLLLYNYIVVLSNVLLHDESHPPTMMICLYRSPKNWLTLLTACQNVIWPRAT